MSQPDAATRRRYAKNRRKNFVAIPFDTSLTLLTLANETVLQNGIFGSSLGEDLFVISIDCYWALRGGTTGEVPIGVGFSHSDLTVAEVAECLGAELTDPDDIIQRERARRPVRRAGMFGLGASTGKELNNGVAVRTKMRMSVGDGHNVNCWARNQFGASLTTGAIVEVHGTLYGRWQR